MRNELSVLLGAFVLLAVNILWIAWAIKKEKRRKDAVKNFKYHQHFSSKEPHTILLVWGLWLVLCFGLSYLVLVGRRVDFFSAGTISIDPIIMLLLLICGDLYFTLKVFLHWRKMVEVNGEKLTYTDGVGRGHKLSAQQITYFRISPKDPTLRINFVERNGKKYKAAMAVPWETSLLLCEWSERYLKKYSQVDMPAGIENAKNPEVNCNPDSSVLEAAQSPDIKALANAIRKAPHWPSGFIGGGVIAILFSIFGIRVGGSHYGFSMGMGTDWVAFGRVIGLAIGGICLLVGCVLYLTEKYKKVPIINHEDLSSFRKKESQQTESRHINEVTMEQNKSLLSLIMGGISLSSGILVLPYLLLLYIIFYYNMSGNVKNTMELLFLFLPLAVAAIMTICNVFLTAFAEKPCSVKYIIGLILSIIGFSINLIFFVWLFRVGIYIT